MYAHPSAPPNLEITPFLESQHVSLSGAPAMCLHSTGAMSLVPGSQRSLAPLLRHWGRGPCYPLSYKVSLKLWQKGEM